MLDILQPQNTYIRLYESNWITAIRNLIHHPFLYIKFKKYIYFSPLPYSEYADYMNKAIYTLDFSHPKQSGITMRCYEAASCKTKIVTNNESILENSFFLAGTVIYIDIKRNYSEKEKQTLRKNFLNVSYPENFHSRSISDFVEDLLK